MDRESSDLIVHMFVIIRPFTCGVLISFFHVSALVLIARGQFIFNWFSFHAEIYAYHNFLVG